MEKLHNTLNQLIDRNDLSVETTESLNELFEILKIIKNCTTSCKNKKIDESDFDEFHELINEIESYLAKLEKKEEQGKKKYCIIDELNKELFRTDNKLNKDRLCASCKKGIEKLTDECGNERIARFFHKYKLNEEYYGSVQWIPSNDFKNVEYLAKDSFGEFHKATWIKYDYYEKKYKDQVVLKRIYNSSDKISDLLKEVK